MASLTDASVSLSSAESGQMAAGSAVLSVQSLHKSYGGTAILKGVSFSLRQGKSLAITGPSGCGKSTLLNIVGMLEVPDSGEVQLLGQPLPTLGSRKGRVLLRDNIGYLFQNGALIPDDTVEENLRVAQTKKMPKSQALGSMLKALDRVGLTGTPKRKTHSLSGGEQQRLAIARLLVKPCDLVLADEPTGALDPKNRDSTLEFMSLLKDEGKAVLVVTHDPAVARWADDTMELR